MIHKLGGEARLVVQNQRDAVLSRNVLGGYDDIFIPVDARTKMDLFDFAARDGATYGRAVKHAGQSHVIHVTRRSSDFVPAFLARHGSSNDVTDGHKLFAGDILYETTGVSNLYLSLGRPLPAEFSPFWLSREFAIAEYAIAAQVSCLDHAAKFFAQIR